MLRELGLPVRFPERTFATVDHIIPTDSQARPLADALAEEMLVSPRANNCASTGSPLRPGQRQAGHRARDRTGAGLTQPGMTIACGDSHTSTHGAFGAVAFGIGTSQVRDVLATQCLAMAPRGPAHRRDRQARAGRLRQGRHPGDHPQLGVKGGVGYAYEYAGPVIDAMTIEER